MKLRLISSIFALTLVLGLMSPGAPAQDGQRRDRNRDRDRNNVQTVYCESGDMKRHWCSEGIGAKVTLVRKRSNAPCIQGRTWGVARNGIWVDRGCRADFEIRRR
jgi:hypothetical protein